MKREPQIFTTIDAQDVPVSDTVLDALEQEEIQETLLRECVRELLTEKKYVPPVEQDVVHGLSFNELKVHLSRHFGKAKITLTSSPLDLERTYPPSTRTKPNGIWYGCGVEWLEFVESGMGGPGKDKNQIWAVKIDMSNVKSLIDTKEIDSFSHQYRDIKRYIKDPLSKRIDWAKVASKFSGIECCPYGVGDWDFRMKHDWYYALDVASGCVWNTSAITNSILVAEKKEDGWEVYV